MEPGQWINPDWINPDWITTDRGISALVGVALTAAVALLIDQRRRHDDSRNRFSEEKLRAYEHIISDLDAARDMLLLFAEFAPFSGRLIMAKPLIRGTSIS